MYTLILTNFSYDAWVWLEFSRKDNAKSSLSNCGFVKDLDYVSAYLDRQGCLTDKTSDEKGKFPEVIKLSCDCFKSWGMMLKTPVGQRIRNYFLDNETFSINIHKCIDKLKLT